MLNPIRRSESASRDGGNYPRLRAPSCPKPQSVGPVAYFPNTQLLNVAFFFFHPIFRLYIYIKYFKYISRKKKTSLISDIYTPIVLHFGSLRRKQIDGRSNHRGTTVAKLATVAPFNRRPERWQARPREGGCVR